MDAPGFEPGNLGLAGRDVSEIRYGIATQCLLSERPAVAKGVTQRRSVSRRTKPPAYELISSLEDRARPTEPGNPLGHQY